MAADEDRIFYSDIDPYDVDRLQFAIEERIGKPRFFVGRQTELQHLLKWIDNIPEKMSKSTALLARRKKGKTAIVERLFNLIFSRNGKVIPFYYEIYERKEWIVDFSNIFYRTFLTQYLAFKLRDTAMAKQCLSIKELNNLAKKNHYKVVEKDLDTYIGIIEDTAVVGPIWQHALSAPHRIAGITGDFILQVIDEFQFLNNYIYWDKEKKNKADDLAGSYLSLAESRIAPLLVTGSWVGWLIYILDMQLPVRFFKREIGNFTDEEAVKAVLNYSNYADVPVTNETAVLIASLCNNDPFYINALVCSDCPAKDLTNTKGVLETFEYEVTGSTGSIRNTWMEYIDITLYRVNDKHAKRMVFFLTENSDDQWNRNQIRSELSLSMEDRELDEKLKALVKGDLIKQGTSNYTYHGIGDPIFDKVIRNEFEDEIKDKESWQVKERIRSETEEQLRQENLSLKGKLNYYKGHLAEYFIIAFLKHRAYKNNPPLSEMVYNYKKGVEFERYRSVSTFTMSPADAPTGEIDIYARSVRGTGTDLVFEVKNRPGKKVSIKEVTHFADKLETMRGEGTNIQGIFYSAAGFTGEAAGYLMEKEIMYTDFKKWWGEEP